MGKKHYSESDIMTIGPPRKFVGSSLNEVAFPIGGIGTGTISLGGRGNLRDFEVMNHPSKGTVWPFTFFALWAEKDGSESVARVLEGRVPPPYRSGFGEPQQQLQGLPRFREAAFTGMYPLAILKLSDQDVPVKPSLKAWNPLIPLNVKDSALPVAIFEWSFRNPSTKPVRISLAASISNPITARDETGGRTSAGSLNAYRAAHAVRGIFLTHPKADPKSPETGTIALVTTCNDIDVQTHWYRGGWWDKYHLFWDDFSSDGRIGSLFENEPTSGIPDVSSLVLHAVIPPRGSVTMPILITWLFPRMANPWPPEGVREPEPLETYAGTQFGDAWAVAEYVVSNLSRLREETELWRKNMFDSTLPAHVIDAVTSQVAVMRSPTCFLLSDGSFYGWEGCRDNAGCCPGNCTHVWNYEQAVAFLFPQLERTMRETEFLYNTRDTGHMGFRTRLPRGSAIAEFKPCADGQMGTIIQAFRDWRLSGDDDFLKKIWPKVKLALEYAWTMTKDKMSAPPSGTDRSYDSLWDPDRDGVMEGEQHNTYDIEFFGPNTMCTAMYLGALRACEEIARYFGENEKAEEYRAIYECGRAKVEDELWNGEYYIQRVMVADGVVVPEHLKIPPALSGSDLDIKYQYGDGCLSDQLLGQWAAHIAGLGYLLDPQRVRTAIKSVFDNNFLTSVGTHANVQRVYALNDEAGLVVCSWPHGNRPALPLVYSDEVWTGIEYQVAAHLIYEGWLEEGLAIVKAVRDRYAGYNRNPWNEVECGHHYARAMASWSVKVALDGFSYNLVEGSIGFAPRFRPQDYQTVWHTGTAWGTYRQNLDEATFTLDVLYGVQKLGRLHLADLPGGVTLIRLPAMAAKARIEGQDILFEPPLMLEPGDKLVIEVEP